MVKPRVWLVAYINRDYIESVEDDLLKYGFKDIRAYIPTVRILKKQFKGRNIYEKVPLLFNYGFFQLNFDKACDATYLMLLKNRIPAIFGWVKDPFGVISKKPKLQPDNKSGNLEAASATEKEISDLLLTSEHLSVFSDEVVDQLEVGGFLILKGYPYENMPAEVVSVSKAKKEVKVRLLLETLISEVTVNFENIFYTVYTDYDSNIKEDSLDELDSKGKRYLDKLYATIPFYDGTED